MSLQERQLVPDSRKGKVRLEKDNDGVLHFQWMTDTGQLETDVVVLPDEATFSKIGPEQERVYTLKFKDKSRTLFFWLQESNSDQDSSLCESVNKVLKYQNDESPQRAQVGGPSGSQLAQMLSGMMSSSQGPSLQQQAKLAAALLSSACGVPPTQQAKQTPTVSLAEVLKPEVLVKYIQQPGMLQSLAEYLPESQREEKDLVDHCMSPQLTRQLKVFSAALQTGQFDPAALGLSVEGYSAIDFLNAIQKLVDQEHSKSDTEMEKE